jgi:four helix bundle protein
MTDRKLTEAMKARTKKYSLRIIKVFRVLPKTDEARLIGKQLFRAGTSVAANYRAVCRARSKADFVSKIGVVVEEADESLFWMELLVEAEIVKKEELALLMKEGNELLTIFAASQITSRGFSRNK